MTTTTIDGITYTTHKGGNDEPHPYYLRAPGSAPNTIREWAALDLLEVDELLDLIRKHGPDTVIDGAAAGGWPDVIEGTR